MAEEMVVARRRWLCQWIIGIRGSEGWVVTAYHDVQLVVQSLNLVVPLLGDAWPSEIRQKRGGLAMETVGAS